MNEQVTEMYAQQTSRGLANFFKSRQAYVACGDAPVVRVRIITDDAGSHWSWWDAERKSHSMIFGSRVLVEICFPYGSRAEEERGRGKVVRVRVEQIAEEAKT